MPRTITEKLIIRKSLEEAKKTNPEDILKKRFCPKCGGELTYHQTEQFDPYTGKVSEIIFYSWCKKYPSSHNSPVEQRIIEVK